VPPSISFEKVDLVGGLDSALGYPCAPH